MGFTDRSISGETPGQPLGVVEKRFLDHQVKKDSVWAGAESAACDILSCDSAVTSLQKTQKSCVFLIYYFALFTGVLVHYLYFDK